MIYPYYDSLVRYYNQQNIVPLHVVYDNTCSIEDGIDFGPIFTAKNKWLLLWLLDLHLTISPSIHMAIIVWIDHVTCRRSAAIIGFIKQNL